MRIVLRLDLKGPRMIQRFMQQKTIARIQVRAIHKIKYIREISCEIHRQIMRGPFHIQMKVALIYIIYIPYIYIKRNVWRHTVVRLW